MSTDSQPVVVEVPTSVSSRKESPAVSTPPQDDSMSDIYGFDFMNDDRPCIVGMACRLPGAITSPSALWDFMMDQKSAQGPVPHERYNLRAYYHPDGSRAGSMDVPGGYFLDEDVRQFDNGFFGINNLEATYMDPQQRKLLEVVFECLESAGASMDSVSGSNTGVYVGNFSVDYQPMQTRDPDYLHRYTSTGSGATIMSNRISHAFNLHGPSFTLDTACSSSIYAVHQALNAIKAGDCDTAIVASANLILSPELHMGAAKGGVLSPSGTCHTFDASADGYGRAEGVNAIYIKRLSAALRNGDKIRAVIRGTAVNANGRTPGISLPSGVLQEAVIRKAYLDAGLDFTGTDYVECHGTGTAVGDPIEVDAVGNCFSPRSGAPLLIGAVKTNVGHSEAASGLTSMIKVILAFERGQIPPTRGVKRLNPKLVLKDRNLKVATEVEEWPRNRRRASVNSFGYGGANAHIILESFESYSLDRHDTPPGWRASSERSIEDFNDIQDYHHQQFLVLPLSAASPKSLEARIQQISQTLPAASHDIHILQNLAFTLSGRRDHLRHKSFVIASAGSSDVIDMADADAAVISNSSAGKLPLAFVFTGQGAQYAGMAKELLDRNSTFRSMILELDAVLQAQPARYRPSWTLEQTMLDSGGTSRVNDVERSQPLCTAVQIALISLLRSWGLSSPTAVVGHSSGEIAAAYTAGLLTAKQAILVAYLRGYAVGQLRVKGAMMAVGQGPEAVNLLIESNGFETQVRVACVNAPESVTLSGSCEAIDILQNKLQSQNQFARVLKTGGRAYHSHMMTDIGALYQDLLTPLFDLANGAAAPPSSTSSSSTTVMYSSVGLGVDQLRIVDSQTNMAAYWRQNLEQPVQFSAALASLSQGGKRHLIEIGPHSALKGPIKQIRTSTGLDKHSLPYSATLVRDEDADLCLKQLAGTLFIRGHDLDWNQVNSLPSSGLQPMHDLPPYQWDYSAGLRWSEPRASVEIRNRKHLRHELLGTQTVTGNGIDYSWRNLLRLGEVPWMKDHKLETQIVFPAAAYLALAIEAISQVTGNSGKALERVAFEFHSVNISAAFVIPEKDRDDLELHTIMSPRKISTANNSIDWHDFSVSSWTAGQTTPHCTGSIRVTDPSAEGGYHVSDADGFDAWSMSRWYAKWHEEGLCFGTHFQSLTSLRTDGERTRTEALSTVRLEPSIVTEQGSTRYPVHPITIDACLQAAILGGTAGHLPALRAWMPVFISDCRIQPQAASTSEDNPQADIHSRSLETGFSTRRIDSTLQSAGRAIAAVVLKDVRMSLYTPGKAVSQQEPDSNIAPYMQRQPGLRGHWKPDVLRLGTNAESPLRLYISAFLAQQPPDMLDDERVVVIAALLDLFGHKNPRMRVLELEDGCGCKAQEWLSILNKEAAFPRCRSWHVGKLGDDGSLRTEDGSEGPFEVVVIPRHSASNQVWERGPKETLSLISDHGMVITRKTELALRELRAAEFNIIDVGKQVLLAMRPPRTTSLQGRNVVFVSKEPTSAVAELAKSLATHLKKEAGVSCTEIVSLGQLDTMQISENDVCVSLLEMEREFLATISSDDMDRLRSITDVITDLLWLTGANMMGENPDPNLTLSGGLSRALMLEQPALRYTILDIGKLTSESDVMSICENATMALVACHEDDDCEFIQANGLMHVNRFSPDFTLNSLFRRRQETDAATEKEKETLAVAGPVRLSIGRVGVTDSMYFQQLPQQQPSLPPAGFVDIEIKAVSLNAKDVYAVMGRVETRNKTTMLDFSGVVTAVGPGVKHLKPGDRAVAWAPSHFGTTERVPAGCVHAMLSDEEFTVMPTMLTVYGTALYALRDRAALRAGESVLIHAGSGGFGIAAIIMAQRTGAVVYTTVGSQTKRHYLVQELGVPDSHIFNSRNASFVQGIMAATGGRGVDVVINSLVGDLLLASWGCLADFGRLVEIGKRELIDAGRLDMNIFLRNTTFTAFDLSEFFYARDPFNRGIWDRLMADTLELYRAGHIKPPPFKVFDVASIAQAYRYFAGTSRVGKVVISLANPQSLVPVAPATYSSVLDPEKVYLLVGCLGGLGRSLSRWMMARGARHFVFLGRSGCDKPSAQQLVSRLEKAGASVDVVRGDVAKSADVAAAVSACLAMGRPIGGVVQAAMGLHEALWTRMPNKAWHTGIQPKYAGTWNLHNALVGRDDGLDFFLLTSSVSGSVGTATESNYCSANGFLDAFAHWRRTQGKPAVSVGLGMISEVGYLHENPEIEALLLRKGIQPLDEQEFLQIVDLALVSEAAHDPAHANLLTGLEPAGVRELQSRGFDVSSHGVLKDARTAVLAASLKAEQEARDVSHAKAVEGGSGVHLVVSAAWFREVPVSFSSVLAPVADAESLQAAVLRVMKKRFSTLILVPLDQIDDHKPLPQYGVDSMIASEFRSWFWTAFRVDLPFLDIMSPQKSLISLAEFVEMKMVEGWKGDAPAKS